jgi:hypothetical protein
MSQGIDHPYSDDTWAPLREAVPSFAAQWASTIAQSWYDPTLGSANAYDLVVHMLALIQSGNHPDEQERFFAALEQALAAGSENVREFLTIAFLEHFASEGEQRSIDLRAIQRRFAGPATRGAWLAALAWTHPELTWSDEHGLQRLRPLSPVVGRFSGVQGKPVEHGYLLEGVLEQGQVEPGQILRFPLNSGDHMRFPIGAVVKPNDASPFTQVTLVHVNERSAEYYQNVFLDLKRERMEFDVAVFETD